MSTSSPVKAKTVTTASSPAAPTTGAGGTPSGAVATLTPAQVQALEATCTDFAVNLGSSATLLSKGSARRLARPRSIATAFVNAVVLAGNKYGVASPSYPTATIMANQQLATNLVGAIDAVETLLKLLKDTSLVAQSNAWTGALVIYKMLSAEAKSNPAIATTIQPLRDQLRPNLLTPSGTKTVKRARSAKAINKAKGGSSGATASPPVPPAAAAASPAVAVGHS